MTAGVKSERLGKLLVVMVFILIVACLPLPVYASIQSDTVLESKPVAEGLVMEKHSVGVGGGKTQLYILRADLSNPYLKINTIVGVGGTLAGNGKVTDMAVNSGAVAAVNADYFQLEESGRPIGMTYKDGRMVTSPPLRSDMYGWGVTRDGKPLIDLFSFTGKVTAVNGQSYTLSGINKPSYYVGGNDSAPVTSQQDALLMYDPFWGNVSRGRIGDSDNVTEVVVSGGFVTAIAVNQAGQKIPADGFVLAGRGKAADFINANIKVGDKLLTDYSVAPSGNDLWAGTGGWCLLVDGGKANSDFPASINGPVARTAIGYTPDRKKILVVVAERSSYSRGMTLNELAEYMAGLNVERALNLDGGGSTTLAARPLGEDSPVLVNRPQNGAQRLVPTALGFFSSAPRGNLAGLILKGPDVILPGDEASFTLKGYDSHYNPVTVDQSEVKWSVTSGPGTFTNNSFKSGTGGLATISASSGGITGTATVKVMGPEDFSRIDADPSSITLQPGKSTAVSVNAIGKDGTVYKLTDSHYSVTVDKGLGTYQNGTFTASNNVSAGEMKITFDGLSLTVPVAVMNDGQAVISYTPGQPGTLKLGNFSLSIPGDALGEPVTLTASYGGEMSVPVPDGYKMLSSVVFKAAGGDTAALADSATVDWTYPAGGGKVKVLQLTAGKWVEVPAAADEKQSKVTCSVRTLDPLALVKDTSPSVVFSDMKGHWAEAVVSRLAGAGIISGYPGNTFDPARQVTRAEFTVLLCKVFGWGPVSGKAGFRDEGAIADWARGYVVAAYKKGVISGYEDHTFRPTRQVTRAEMAATISKALALKPSSGLKLEKTFRDGGSIDKWAVGPISAVYSAGLMKGDNEDKFRAKDGATRAESAVVMDNVMKYLKK